MRYCIPAVLLCCVISSPAANSAEPNSEIGVIIDLRDGSRLIGKTAPHEFGFVNTDGKVIRLSTAQIVEMTADKDRELYTLQTGDRTLRGVVEMKTFTVRCVFGSVNVPFDEVARVRLIQLNLGLIVHFPFDGDFRDHSGNNNDGKPHENVKFEKGRIGKAASFDGESDYISVEPKSRVSKIKDFTISAWVYVRQWKKQYHQFEVDRQYVFDGFSEPAKGINNSNGFGLMCDGNATNEWFECYVCVDNANHVAYRPPLRLSGRWRLLTLARSGNRERIYVDGQLFSASKSYSRGTTNQALNMKHTWFIGTYEGNDPNYISVKRGYRFDLDGLIDDLRIYNRALSDLEIQRLAETVKGN